MPEINLSTVYRQVWLLLADGEIAKVKLRGESARYAVAREPGAHAKDHAHDASGDDHHHHYFHCSNCGQVFLLRACPGPLDHLEPKGFQVTSHEVTLHGLCACARQVRKKAQKTVKALAKAR